MQEGDFDPNGITIEAGVDVTGDQVQDLSAELARATALFGNQFVERVRRGFKERDAAIAALEASGQPIDAAGYDCAICREP